jgi:hypothetical protein
VSIGYGFDKLKIFSALEYRVDDTEEPDHHHPPNAPPGC